MEMKFRLFYLWCTLVGYWSALSVSAAHDYWDRDPVSVVRALSVARGGHVDLRGAISLHSDAITENCSVQFIATDVCGYVRPSRFSCGSYLGKIIFQHRGCLAEREFATFLVSSPTETSANVSIFSVDIMIKASQVPTSEITLELLENNLSDGVPDQWGAYNYKIIFPTELIGRCHYEIVTDWPHLDLPEAGTIIGATNQPLPCGFVDSSGLKYFPRNNSSLLDYFLIKVHSHNQYNHNQFLILPIKLELQENSSNRSEVEQLPTQVVVIRQGANTPIPSSLISFASSSLSHLLNNSHSLYRFTFPVLDAGSFRTALSSFVNVTHTTFTNRDLLKDAVTFYPSFSAPEITVFQYTISNVAGEVVAMGDINVLVEGHRWEWPVQRTNQPLTVLEGGTSVFDQRTLDFYLQTDLCLQQATMTVLVPPKHGHLTFLNGSIFGETGLLVSAIRNGTVLVYHHSSNSKDLTDSIILEVSCPGGPDLQVFTSVLVAPSGDSSNRLLRGWDINVHQGFATPISPSTVVTFNLDSPMDDVSVALGDDTGGQVVKLDRNKLAKKDISYFFPFVDSKSLRTQNVVHEVLNLSLSDLEDYTIWYVPTANSSMTHQLLTFSIDDSTATVGVDIIGHDLNQSLFLSTLGEYPSVPLNLPLPLNTRTGTYITSSFLYSQAPPNSPDKVVYTVQTPPTRGWLCLLSGEKCQSSIQWFTQRDINSQNVYYKPEVTEDSLEEDSFEFELTVDGFHQQTATLHKFHFKPVETEIQVAMERIFYVTAGGSKAIAPRHFRPYSKYFNSREIVFEITRSPHYGRLELRGQPNPSNFSFEDLLGTRDLEYKHYPSATKACSDQFSFTVGNATHSLDGTMRIAIKHGREDVHVHVDMRQHTLFLDQRKFVFGSEDINVTSSFCLDFVMFTLSSLPSLGMLSLVDNKHNTVIQLQENSTFSANDVYSGFLHYTFTNILPVTNQISDLFILTAEDPTSSWPTPYEPRTVDDVRHFHVIIIPSPDVKHELAIDVTSPGFLTWLPSYERYGYIFSENDIVIFNSTIEPHQVVIQLDREPEFGSIWKSNSMDNIFTVEDINNGLVWYRSDVRLDGFSSDSFLMSIIINLMDFSMLVERQEFVINWSTVQLVNNRLRVSESEGQVEIIVRRSGALWFESRVLLTAKVESAVTNTDCRPPADFCNMTQMVIFPINATENRIIVEIDDDDIAEDTETFMVELSEPTNAVIDETRNHTKIWITDTEDYSIITMLGDASTNSECSYVNRVEESDGKATITLQRTRNLQQRVGVVCFTGTQSNNARANQLSDYVPRHRNQSNSTVWFDVNQESAVCEIEIIDDYQAEYVERFYVKLDEATLGRAILSEPGAVHCVEISNDRNDWPEVNFTALEVDVRESNVSDIYVPITVLQTGPDLSQETTVKFQWVLQSKDSAEFGEDFALAQNESCPQVEDSNLTCVTFAPGERRAVFHVIIKRDSIIESNESFHLILHSAFKVYPDILKVVIIEGYSPSLIRFAHPVNHLQETARLTSVPVLRSGFLNYTVSVYYRLKGAPSHGNATPGASNNQPGVDFVTSRTLSKVMFGPGENIKGCNLYINDDDVWEGPESFTIVLELGDDGESLGAVIPEETAYTQVIIDDPEDIPTMQLREVKIEAQEPLSNFDIDKTVVPLTLNRTGDLSYTTSVRYQMSQCNPSSQPDASSNREVVFLPHEVQKQIEIELTANHQSNSGVSLTISLCHSRVLDADNVPVRIGPFNQTVIDVTNREYFGPFFPELPVVVSEGATVTVGLGDIGRTLYYDQPLLCITPCSSQYVGNIERIDSYRQACTSQNISQTDTVYSWEISEDGFNFTTLDHYTSLTNTHSERLDTFYLTPNLHVRCSAQAVSHTGVKGHTRMSGNVFLNAKKYPCDGRGQSEVELTSYSGFSGQDKVHDVASQVCDNKECEAWYPCRFPSSREVEYFHNMLYCNWSIRRPWDMLRLSIRVSHRPNSIPVLSTHPTFPNITNTTSHICSTLIPGGSWSWLSNESLYSHLNRERCVWEFTKWLPVEDLMERCGGQRSDSSAAAISSISILVYHSYEQYDSSAVIELPIVGQINYSMFGSTPFLPPPLHTLTVNRYSDAYIYPVAVQNTSTTLEVYFYSVLPLRRDGLTYVPSNTTNLSLLHTDYTTNTSKGVWRLQLGRTLPNDIAMEFQLPCEGECGSTNETLMFSLGMSSERGQYRAALRASITLRHSPQVVNNYTETFTLGDRVYVVFDLDPSIEIQDGFMFAVSELYLCRATAMGNCSKRHAIVTGVVQDTSSFDVQLEQIEHTAVLHFSTSPINVDQSSSLWYLDLTYGISNHHEMVIKENTILNISFIDPSLQSTSSLVDVEGPTAATSKQFLYAAVAILLVALVTLGVGFTVIGLLVWTSRMRGQIKRKVQSQLEAQRLSGSRKNSVALNNKKRDSAPSGVEEQRLRRSQSTIGFPTREKLKRVKTKRSSHTAARAEVNVSRTHSSSEAGASARPVTVDEGASVQPFLRLPSIYSGVSRARSLPNLTILETRISEGFFMGDPQPRKLHFQTTVSKVNTERWHLNKWAQHHIKANKQLETARTIHDLATRRRNYGANEKKQNVSQNKESHSELASYAVRSLAASAKTPEPEKGPRTKL